MFPFKVLIIKNKTNAPVMYVIVAIKVPYNNSKGLTTIWCRIEYNPNVAGTAQFRQGFILFKL